MLEQNQWTVPVFQNLLQILPTLKRDFELRRVIFGITSIIANPQALPGIVQTRLPEITRELAGLTLKMRREREKIVEDNEEHVKEETEKEDKKKKGEESDEDEGEGNEEGDEEEEKEDKKGKKEEDDEEEEDDDDDSDYEYTGGDLAIYESALDDADELLFVKESLEKLNTLDANYVLGLFSAMNEQERAQFNENMASAQALKDREEVVRIKCDELVDKKGL